MVVIHINCGNKVKEDPLSTEMMPQWYCETCKKLIGEDEIEFKDDLDDIKLMPGDFGGL